MRLKAILSPVVATLVFASAQHLSASTLLIDRGLPDTNLNHASGASRSNVSWAYGVYPEGSWLVGDSFTNTSLSSYAIDTIRVWTTGATDVAMLYGGVDGSTTYSSISTSFTSTATQYAGGLNYQNTSGTFSTINQIDFTVNLTLAAGETFNFFFDGTRPTTPYIPFLHSSNAALSGTPQEGADNTLLYALRETGDTTIDASNTGTWTSLGNGWDKATDVNVQVYGNATASVPDATATGLLLGVALLGLNAFRPKSRK